MIRNIQVAICKFKISARNHISRTFHLHILCHFSVHFILEDCFYRFVLYMELFCKLEEVVYVDIVRVESFLVIFMQIPIKLLYLELYVELSTHYFLSQNFSHFYFIRISYSFVSMWKQPKDNWILYNRRPDRSHHVYKHEKNTHILTCDVVCYCFFLIMHKLKHIKPKQCYFRLSQYANTTDPLNGGSWGAGYSGGCSPILLARFINFVQYLEHLLAWNPPHLFFFLIRPDFY